MNKIKHPFIFKYSEENNIHEYLGSDSLPIEETYNLYLSRCEEFKIKARKYAKENLCLKNSYLHHVKLGYKGSQELEEEVLLKRKEYLMQYRKTFNITFFDEYQNSMYECMKGKSKKIRIIRELFDERSEEFSEDVNKKNTAWFKRYCILSKFIQAARKIILLKRLEKALMLLRPQVQEKIRQNEAAEKELKAKEIKEGFKMKRKCCKPKSNTYKTY